MKDKQQSKRNLRKSVVRRLEQGIELDQLNYKKRTQAGRSQAKVTGLLVASFGYMAIFGLVYLSWTRGTIDTMTMNKISWIMMIPATLIGALGWLISANRKEYPVRQEIRAQIRRFEGDSGSLWRFEPALKEITLKKIDIEILIDASRCNELEKMAPEDICATLLALHEYLSQSGIKPAILSEIEANFSTTNDNGGKADDNKDQAA